MSDNPSFSRVCPSCGRRVPRKVALCRCGAELSAEPEPAPPESLPAIQPEHRSSSGMTGVGSVFTVVASLGAMVFGVFLISRPAPATREAPPIVPIPEPAAEQRFEPPNVPLAELPSARAALEPAAPPARAQAVATAAPPPPPTSLEDVISQVMPAVVLVETSSGRGSAFFVSADTLLTNAHVVGSSSSVTIRRMGGETALARVASVAPQFDIAVLKMTTASGQPSIALGSVLNARVGQEVIAIGSALGTLQNTVTRGIVSAVRQSGAATLVQTDAAINPGNSGGPLLDRTGSAIGITTMGYSGRQGLNFAVAIDHARALLEGRPVPAASAASATSAIQSLSPAAASESEQAREEGSRVYEQTVVQLAQRADNLDQNWQRFRASCYEGRIGTRFDREWYALYDSRAMQGAVSPGCGPWFDAVRREAAEIRNEVLAAEEAARRANVYPGVRRDLRRRHRLDYGGWER